MHLIRANLVCVCVFFNFFFFENLKKIQSCPILHLPYKKPFIFSAFFIPDFLLFFIEYPFEMSVLDILFLENSQKKHNSFTPRYTTNILQSCCWQFISHHRRGKLYFTRFSFENSNSIPLIVMGNFFFFNYWYLVALCSFNLIVSIYLSSLLLSIYCSRFIHSSPS